MKKILGLTLAVVLVIGLVAGGTWALFSDTETSATNVFTAGTIDIEIEDGTAWTTGFFIEDMKPCETGYITFVIRNVGTNPVVVWKTLDVIDCSQGVQSEPEIEWETNNNAKWDIDTVIDYDLSVIVPAAGAYSDMGDPTGSGWWQLIYDQNITISKVESELILLGMIPVGGTMEVTQSYHMKANTENWAQGDTMNFTIEIYGEQLTGSLTLENKSGKPDWQLLLADGIKATLTYNTMGPTFDYTLTAKGLTPGNYSLIYYADPWPGNGDGTAGYLIDTMTADGSGDINTSGSVNLNMDLPASGDNNYPAGAKIWLIPSSAYDAGTNSVTVWPSTNDWLFDTALMTYDDTDV